MFKWQGRIVLLINFIDNILVISIVNIIFQFFFCENSGRKDMEVPLLRLHSLPSLALSYQLKTLVLYNTSIQSIIFASKLLYAINHDILLM